jgi:hypothetical protein
LTEITQTHNSVSTLPQASSNNEANLPDTNGASITAASGADGAVKDSVALGITKPAPITYPSAPPIKGEEATRTPVSSSLSSLPSKFSPTVKPAGGVAPKPASLASAVNVSIGVGAQIPKGLKGINTSKPASDAYDYFHGMIYGETGARKTTTAAKMFGPENTLIVLCRQPEQLIPLRGMGYRVLHAENDDALVFALTYPEKAAATLLDWPEWGTLRDRALVFDDVTEGINLLMERNATNDDGKERKDMRQVYKFAGSELKELFQSLRRKKLHLIIVALAKISTNPISNEERIAPNMPPSMVDFVTTDIEFVFYIDKSKWKFVTDNVYRAYKGTDEKGKEIVFRREITGKNKIPGMYLGNVFPATNEVSMAKRIGDADMRRVWDSVKSGTPIESVGGGVTK